MEWLDKMNLAIDYIETNITQKVDYAKVASIACCSLPRFQSMFAFITDITPSEYGRRRRMALSADELVNSKTKVIDLSFKYGYESPEAFARSFKAFHGIPPSAVRKFGKYTQYPRISFQIKITGGHFAMETTAQFEAYKNILLKMEIIELPETLKIAGLTSKELPNFGNIEVYKEKYNAHVVNKHSPYTEIGISSNLCNGGWYTFGCQVDSIDVLPDGLIGFDTGLKRFASLTFRVQPGGDLVGGADGPGEGMNMATEYLENMWLPKNKDRVCNHQIVERAGHRGHCFEIMKSEANYRITNLPTEGLENSYCLYYWIEVYKTRVQDDPEMCFYIPLK